jgi:hypothetical protein
VIRSKRAMYRLYEQGRLGNKLNSWSSLNDFEASDYTGTVSLRYAGAAGGGWVAYEVPREGVREMVGRWQTEGASLDAVRINESAPDSQLILQGEVAEAPYYSSIVLRFSTWRGKMRDAMRFAEHVEGVSALAILHSYLWPSSYEDIQELLGIYPGAVVEFSAYESALGCYRGRNTVIWEVRNY